MSSARLLVSAAHKSSGKTTLSVGLCAALRAQGLQVQPFKKGPDYIDPMWLAQAAGRDCYNLDPYLSSGDEIKAAFAQHAAGTDISLVEGNKGLHDGVALDGSNSNAALAHLLGLPVLLVIDARGMTRGIAPLILGFQAFDRRICIAGVVLNQVGGSRHEAKLRAVIEHYTDVPVLGALAHEPALGMNERHLGLTPSIELDDAAQRISRLGRRVAEQVDLARVIELAGEAEPMPALPRDARRSVAASGPKVRIGIARDKAFGFYYAEDLAALRAAGAELLPIDTLHDARLPALDGLFIGGGFPEVFMDELQANASLRADIAAAIDAGLPTYAECGGLMYLARSLQWQGRSCRMVGAIPADVSMHAKPVGRGYMRLAPTAEHPWPASTAAGPVLAHEFHHSSLDNLPPGQRFAYRVERGHGIDGQHDGLLHRNLLASYAHLRDAGGSDWPARFVAFVRKQGASRGLATMAARPPSELAVAG
ncbi:MAG: dsrN [Proteobacteria bacterium]|nr:dsrN [Pseudomonadota bacterium]